MERFVRIPKTDVSGNAGSSNPMNKEIRYKTYVEKEKEKQNG